jgi:hypothetical protein
MVTPARPADGVDVTRGLGLFRHRVRGETVICHSGAIFGFRAHLAHWPAHDLTVAAMANSNPFPVEQLAHGLARRALGLTDVVHTAVTLGEAALAACAGRFQFHTTEVLDLAPAEGALASTFPEAGSRWRPCGDDCFFLEGDPEVTFRFVDGGRSAVVLADYRTPMTGRRIG